MGYGFGGNGSLKAGCGYESLLKFMTTPRKQEEKKLGNLTVAKMGGWNEGKETITIQHYTSDILKLFPDGRMHVMNSTRCTSQVTQQRLRHYSGVRLVRLKLPKVNGRLPTPEYAWFLQYRDQTVAYKGFKACDYIEIAADGTIDMNTVSPHEIEVINDPQTLRQQARTGGAIFRQLLIRHKVGVEPAAEPKQQIDDWIFDRLDKPLLEIDYHTAPLLHDWDIRNKSCGSLSHRIRRGAISTGKVSTQHLLTL